MEALTEYLRQCRVGFEHFYTLLEDVCWPMETKVFWFEFSRITFSNITSEIVQL